MFTSVAEQYPTYTGGSAGEGPEPEDIISKLTGTWSLPPPPPDVGSTKLTGEIALPPPPPEGYGHTRLTGDVELPTRIAMPKTFTSKLTGRIPTALKRPAGPTMDIDVGDVPPLPPPPALMPRVPTPANQVQEASMFGGSPVVLLMLAGVAAYMIWGRG